MEKKRLMEHGYGDMEAEAEKIAKSVERASKQAVRTIFTTILEMERQPEKMPLAIHKLYYHAKRNPKVMPMVEEIKPLLKDEKEEGVVKEVDVVKKEEEVKKLEEFVEAIVAYHYYYSKEG